MLSIKPYLHTQPPEPRSYWKVSWGWGHLITWNGPMMGHLNSFSASGGGIWTKFNRIDVLKLFCLRFHFLESINSLLLAHKWVKIVLSTYERFSLFLLAFAVVVVCLFVCFFISQRRKTFEFQSSRSRLKIRWRFWRCFLSRWRVDSPGWKLEFTQKVRS